MNTGLCFVQFLIREFYWKNTVDTAETSIKLNLSTAVRIIHSLKILLA